MAFFSSFLISFLRSFNCWMSFSYLPFRFWNSFCIMFSCSLVFLSFVFSAAHSALDSFNFSSRTLYFASSRSTISSRLKKIIFRIQNFFKKPCLVKLVQNGSQTGCQCSFLLFHFPQEHVIVWIILNQQVLQRRNTMKRMLHKHCWVCKLYFINLKICKYQPFIVNNSSRLTTDTEPSELVKFSSFSLSASKRSMELRKSRLKIKMWIIFLFFELTNLHVIPTLAQIPRLYFGCARRFHNAIAPALLVRGSSINSAIIKTIKIFYIWGLLNIVWIFSSRGRIFCTASSTRRCSSCCGTSSRLLLRHSILYQVSCAIAKPFLDVLAREDVGPVRLIWIGHGWISWKLDL